MMKRQMRFDDSSNLKQADFDSESEWPLTLQFVSGAVYRYRNVQTHQFTSLCSAESAGAAVRVITGQPKNYPCEKISDAPPPGSRSDDRRQVALELIASLPHGDVPASDAKHNLSRAVLAAQEALK